MKTDARACTEERTVLSRHSARETGHLTPKSISGHPLHHTEISLKTHHFPQRVLSLLSPLRSTSQSALSWTQETSVCLVFFPLTGLPGWWVLSQPSCSQHTHSPIAQSARGKALLSRTATGSAVEGQQGTLLPSLLPGWPPGF